MRHRATYDRSLSVLGKVKNWRGDAHLHQIRPDAGAGGNGGGSCSRRWRICARAGCDILTLGQYLQPTLRHLPVVEFVPPETFARYKEAAGRMGFLHVASGPMVRSSYHADEFRAPGMTSRRQ